jgi:hypothetical protein
MNLIHFNTICFTAELPVHHIDIGHKAEIDTILRRAISLRMNSELSRKQLSGRKSMLLENFWKKIACVVTPGPSRDPEISGILASNNLVSGFSHKKINKQKTILRRNFKVP